MSKPICYGDYDCQDRIKKMCIHAVGCERKSKTKQTKLTFGKVEIIKDFEPKDAEILKRWSKIDVVCCWCLYKGKLSEFVVKLKRKRKGHKISLSRCECPDCHIGHQIKKLLKVSDMELEEFGWYFWEYIFIWGAYERVSWDKFKERLKLYPYEDQQKFWNVYHRFKKDKSNALQDREDELFYKQEHERLLREKSLSLSGEELRK